MRDDAEIGERQQVRRIALWNSPWVWAWRVLPEVQSAAEGTKLCWGTAAVMAAGGPDGRAAAVRGVASMVVAQLLAHVVAAQLPRRREPSARLSAHAGLEGRPDRSSFPAGHTAAVTGFATAVAHHAPLWGAVAAAPSTVVAVARLRTGTHCASDIAAGAVIGSASTWLICHTREASTSAR